MPDDALPQPWPNSNASWTREWRDALGRPMRSGTVTLTPNAVDGIVAAPVVVQLLNGVAAAPLAPGTYTLTGTVRTHDRHDVRLQPEDVTVDP